MHAFGQRHGDFNASGQARHPRGGRHAQGVQLPHGIEHGVDKHAPIAEQARHMPPWLGRFLLGKLFDKRLQTAHAHILATGPARRLKLARGVRQLQKGASVALAQRRRASQKRAHLCRQLQKPQAVGNRRGTAAQAASEFLLRNAVLAQDGAIGLRFLQIVQVLARNVFNQRHQTALQIVRFQHHARGALPRQQAQCPQAALAGNEFIAAVHATHHQRRKQAVTGDGRGQGADVRLYKALSRIARVGR